MLAEQFGFVWHTTPQWQNHCNHKPDTFVGSVQYRNEQNQEAWLDVYVYQDDSWGVAACLRCSNDASDYYSPGSLANLFQLAHAMPAYAAATNLLNNLGFLKWQLKEIKSERTPL